MSAKYRTGLDKGDTNYVPGPGQYNCISANKYRPKTPSLDFGEVFNILSFKDSLSFTLKNSTGRFVYTSLNTSISEIIGLVPKTKASSGGKPNPSYNDG